EGVLIVIAALAEVGLGKDRHANPPAHGVPPSVPDPGPDGGRGNVTGGRGNSAGSPTGVSGLSGLGVESGPVVSGAAVSGVDWESAVSTDSRPTGSGVEVESLPAGLISDAADGTRKLSEEGAPTGSRGSSPAPRLPVPNTTTTAAATATSPRIIGNGLRVCVTRTPFGGRTSRVCGI